MARTKTTRRTYGLGTSQDLRTTENNSRQAENLLVEDSPREAPVNQTQDECTTIQLKASEMPPALATLAKTLEQSDVVESPIQNSPITECQQDTPAVQTEEIVSVSNEISANISEPQETSLDKNDDSLELDWSMSGNRDTASTDTLPDSTVNDIDVDDSHSISRDSPLNLAWDSSMKENFQRQADAPIFRPMTPDNLIVPVDDIFSPTTQKHIRTTIKALFPNGPPPPPPVRPVRKAKKGDEPYIVNCTKRPRVPSPKSLNVFTGDKYGITSTTNCDPDEPEEECTPEKRAKRGTYGSISKSTFNRQTNEIADRLKLYEKIDRLVGRTPKEPVGLTTKRSFSPLPSTSTDNETIMKNDKHFSESLNCDDFDIDEDDDLPEVIWESSNYKNEKHPDISSSLASKDIKKEKNDCGECVLVETNEDINNNNNVISIDDDFSEIQFDKFMPKEKIVYYPDLEPKKEPEDAVQKKIKINDYFPAQPKNQPLTASTPPTTSTEVICVEDTFNNIINHTLAHSTTPTVLRASNRNATATETGQSDLVIEVPDIIEPINMSRHAPIRSTWDDEVQFISEERLASSSPTETTESIPSTQPVPPDVPAPPSVHTPEVIDELQRILTSFTEHYSKRKTKKKTKKAKSKVNSCASNETASVDENTAPAAEIAPVNNENTAPVNQALPDSNNVPSANSSPGKRIGECPICLDSLQRGSIASTNCGHVFCLECIKQSLKYSGKSCPTCRKQLKGVGYHQVFL